MVRVRTEAPVRPRLLLFVLAALTAVAPFATDMYVPGFPELTRSLNTDSAGVQLSMTAFLLGLAVGQIVLGPISDALGRRPLLLFGAALFTVFSVVCALAPGIEVLVAARLLQGFTGAAGIVVARAVVADVYEGAAAARRFSTLVVITSVAPIAAPVLGGGILAVSSWPFVFVALALFGLLLVAGVLGGVPETLPPERRHAAGIGATFRAMGRLLSRRTMAGYVLVASCNGISLFAYIAGSSFVFEDLYGASATQYSLIFATNALGMLAGATIFGRLAGRVRPRLLLASGVLFGLIAAALLVVLLVSGLGGLVSTWVLLFFAIGTLGFLIPSVTTLGQEYGREASGAASALLGGGMFVLGAIASPLVGAIGVDNALPMAVFVLVGFAGSGLAFASTLG
ncbi:multidrug effflux MFS transporter [Amycolatopsis acidicola]|uniref:Multidrug effflux MFS transporter n=1 Tax=Amycolatopsis acidicola TaxID=2596893 RepID=A0A5N0UPY9_9PSEU|nr:multidrug effflux MFS transporter [Amycolatopsis acidicola]